MKVKFNVTANDIKYGRPADGRHCPIHRSLARRKPFKGKDFTVSGLRVKLDGETFVLPMECRVFIRTFDSGLPVEPFEGEIECLG